MFVIEQKQREAGGEEEAERINSVVRNILCVSTEKMQEEGKQDLQTTQQTSLCVIALKDDPYTVYTVNIYSNSVPEHKFEVLVLYFVTFILRNFILLRCKKIMLR